MNQATGDRVVHLVPPNGGGVDRFVRDLCTVRRADWLLHVSDEQCVVECADQDLFIPIALQDLAGLIERAALGRAAALHAHSTVAAVRAATVLLAQGMDLPYVVTLHDVEFAAAGVEPAERERRCEFVRNAARRLAPSAFIAKLARQVLGDRIEVTVVENGVDAQAPVTATRGGEQFPVAVIGAIGQHKGLAQLTEVAHALPPATRIVLIGYADGQLGPGWLVPDRVWVHGVFEPAQLPALVAHYGAALAFFAKGQPESYCYALSDAWLAGLPVVGPDWGAIGERVRAHGGGRLYDPDAPATEVAAAISRQLEQGVEGRGHVADAVASLASMATMVQTMNKIYAAVAAAPTAPDLEALQRLASPHLDSRFFRRELLRLQGDLAAAQAQRDNALQELQTLAGNFEQRGQWIDHLQQAQDELQQAVGQLRSDLHALRDAGEAMRQDYAQAQAKLVSLQAENEALQAAFVTLKEHHEAIVRRLTWPLQMLPASWRPRIIRMAKRVVSVGNK